MSENLAVKWRPRSFSEFLGNEAVVSSLSKIIETENKLPNCMLLYGNSGIGKTSLARICAGMMNCHEDTPNLIEINGSLVTGIDSMRDVIESLKYTLLGSNTNRVIIIDECHRISPQAFDSILKDIEEPAHGIYWILCSTNISKLPKAIATRAHKYELKPVKPTLILQLLNKVADAEKFTVDKSVLNAIAIKCDGSPRQALTYLSMVRSCVSPAEAQELIKDVAGAEGTPSTIELCRLINKKAGWHDLTAAIRVLDEDNETVRLIILNYFNKVIMGAKSEGDIMYYCKVLHAFSGNTFNPSEKIAPILVACSRFAI